jgi:purine-nucleoside phosphorylase
MNPLKSKVEEATNFLAQYGEAPETGIVLGSGLGIFAERLHDVVTIPYGDIPYFQQSGVSGHSGELLIGKLSESEKPIAVMAGRTHIYEGYSIHDIVHPVRVLANWGLKSIVLTNAAGTLIPEHPPGTFLLIRDHINLTGKNPLADKDAKVFGKRFIDMSKAYDPTLSDLALNVAVAKKIDLYQGTYLGLMGPSYETPAEIRAFRVMGASAVGMSTVCETIALHQMGVRVVGISCLTNWAAGMNEESLHHDEVKETANRVRTDMCRLLEGTLLAIGQQLSN